MNPRLIGLVMVLAGLGGFRVFYAGLAAARDAGALGSIGWIVGLTLGVAGTLLVLSLGVHVVVHGLPDWRMEERARLVRSLLDAAEKEGQSSAAEVLEHSDLTRMELAELLCMEAADRGFSGYLDWRIGVLVHVPDCTPGGCPLCGAVLPEPEDVRVLRCGKCGVDAYPRRVSQ